MDDSDVDEDSDEEDSKFDENDGICMLEKLDFNAEMEIDSDLEEDS